MKRLTALSLLMLSSFFLSGCAADGSFDTQKALSIGGGIYQVTTLSEEDVQHAASLAAVELDKKTPVADLSNSYAVRLQRMTNGIQRHDGLTLNFKVYLAEDVNAFAMADGTVRVYSGLLDAMPDDQVFAVIAHEIGHVKLKHSYDQMRESILSDVAFQAAAAMNETISSLTSSQIGQIGKAAINAHFSQSDELEADRYSVKMLASLNKDPLAMRRAIKTLENLYGAGGGFLSSHPSNPKRIEQIEKEVSALR